MLQPPEPRKALPESCEARLHLRIVLGPAHQHSDVVHVLGLLCTRRERPSCCRTSEKRDELSPSHDEEFPSRVGRISSWFGLETSMPARGRAGSNRAVLTLGTIPSDGMTTLI